MATKARGSGDTSRQLPSALENEAALLGSLILDWRITGDVLQILKGPDDFYYRPHAQLYRVLVEMYDAAKPIEMPQLKQRLEDLGILEAVGGVDYLIRLVESVPSAASAPYYAKIIRDKAVLRGIIDAADSMTRRAFDTADPVGEQLDAAEQAVFNLADSEVDQDAARLSDLLQETYAKLEANDGRSAVGLPTGYHDYDAMTCGLQPGDLVILAARPSMGKTALALNIAEHLGAAANIPVAVFSMEMGKQQVGTRMMCSFSGVDASHVRSNMLTEQEFSKIQDAVGALADAPIYIDDTPGLSLLALRARARRLVSRHRVQVIFIDYLQLMNCHGSENRQQEVSAISRGVKALARELSVPVVCLSQLNRQPEGREDHRPRMSDLRESGAIEQDADVVALLHREDYYHRDHEGYQPTNTAEVIIAKQRNGPVGTVKLQFDRHTTRFNNLANTQQWRQYEESKL